MLEELVLGSDGDELPLVVVEGLVEGGAAAEHAAETEANGGGASVIAGDTIIAVYGSTGSFNVEATSYESTIGAIGALAQAGAPLTLTLGRIVRRGRAAVTTVDRDGSESQFVCYEGENLRMGLLRRGLRLNDQTARRYDNKPKGTGDCGGNGLCATCVVSILDGKENLTPAGASEKNLLARVARWRQSCRAYVQCPEGETDVRVKIALSPRSESDEDMDGNGL